MPSRARAWPCFEGKKETDLQQASGVGVDAQGGAAGGHGLLHGPRLVTTATRLHDRHADGRAGVQLLAGAHVQRLLHLEPHLRGTQPGRVSM